MMRLVDARLVDARVPNVLVPNAPPTAKCAFSTFHRSKALGVDVHKNLQVPRAGIQAAYAAAQLPVPDISTGVRSGDTTPSERRRLVSHPPDILITTPESLYLMLTSAAAEILSEVECVVVDEVHALAGSKRGAHLAVSLERLDDILPQPAQRIGLSATVRPPQEVARFLGGVHPIRIIGLRQTRCWKRLSRCHLWISRIPWRRTSPWDWAGIARTARGFSIITASTPRPAIEHAVYERVNAARSTIVFANSRRSTERMTAALNDIHAERTGGSGRYPLTPRQRVEGTASRRRNTAQGG